MTRPSQPAAAPVPVPAPAAASANAETPASRTASPTRSQNVSRNASGAAPGKKSTVNALPLPPAGPQWYGSLMGTGIAATLTQTLSGDLPGAQALAVVLLVIGWFIFMGLTAAFGLRIVRRPAVLAGTIRDLPVLATWGMVAMGVLSLGSATATVVPAHWPSLAPAAWAVDGVLWTGPEHPVHRPGRRGERGPVRGHHGGGGRSQGQHTHGHHAPRGEHREVPDGPREHRRAAHDPQPERRGQAHEDEPADHQQHHRERLGTGKVPAERLREGRGNAGAHERAVPLRAGGRQREGVDRGLLPGCRPGCVAGDVLGPGRAGGPGGRGFGVRRGSSGRGHGHGRSSGLGRAGHLSRMRLSCSPR